MAASGLRRLGIVRRILYASVGNPRAHPKTPQLAFASRSPVASLAGSSAFVSVPRRDGAVAHEQDKAEEYRTKALQAREKAEAMLDEEARRIMFQAAEMWEAMATSLERHTRPK